ncbi:MULTISPECIES: protein phosphatase 2C domain-containing protein [unclassified Nodularia (in: cyanobacteria)]|uniref:PP2C family protein-serine/threonine phosphatase n=1 Tax=unclassified Nodularia (in: cyanobacteria) TaxID=2656917 RepID=UPI0018828F64|nr:MULTISPECIES: protein phosphatase 2C domain-containing protein [unclassified Nodularia (in: cyanobacteria)]MBE9199659.1 protein phosphatase 2C domain-containing protein [Nodularia sp. LEGE 06071]MCC2692232.1 protein phosphatase 2C domain-containing protein [Nodularia sp. LEGE 04288]
MENDAATLYCPNEACLAANPLTHKFCQRCSTPLPKRYLWAVGDCLIVGSPGDVLADRYLVISKSVVLDTKPRLLPQSPELDNLQGIKAYLRLIPYSLNVPQVYGILPLSEGQSHQEILLLEQPPLSADVSGLQVQLCNQLNIAWRDATSMRQLNWLWQIANLWQPLKSEGVATSLIDPYVLRVEGPLVRLLELRFDAAKSPGLPELGAFWQQLQSDSKPAIAEFIHEISNFLIQGKINSPEVLIAVLDQGLAELGSSQTPTIKIVTKTDTGPSRQRNEDACYPASGTVVNKPPQVSALAIVCDGIGGHQGGNVASNLAIETIHQQVQQLTKVPYDHIEPSLLLADLDNAAAIANDKISQRNDSEHRQARQRMGTTLVMALPIAHEMYITHVGDSRAYWITRQGCYQVTLDDDVASREVRLGYAIYREAVQQGGAGSLVQALGMSPSNSLHPTSQRFILDEDAIFLLTSDGLTDFDRVEDYWETEILPILHGEADIVQVAENLVELANTRNGHDNVTLALIHHKVKYCEPELALKAVIPNISSLPSASSVTKGLQPTLLDGSPNQKTKVIPEDQLTAIAKLPLSFIVPFLLVILAGSVGYWIMRFQPLSEILPTLTGQPTPTPTTPVIERSLDNLAPGWVIQSKTEIPLSNLEILPPESFLQVIKIEPNPQPGTGDLLVHLRLCSLSTTNSFPTESLTTTETQIQLSQLKTFGVSVLPFDSENPCDPVSSPTSAPNDPILTEPEPRSTGKNLE